MELGFTARAEPHGQGRCPRRPGEARPGIGHGFVAAVHRQQVAQGLADRDRPRQVVVVEDRVRIEQATLRQPGAQTRRVVEPLDPVLEVDAVDERLHGRQGAGRRLAPPWLFLLPVPGHPESPPFQVDW